MKALVNLPQFAGFPVPFVVKWIEGKPDFRIPDPEKLMTACKEHLCGICGQNLIPFRQF